MTQFMSLNPSGFHTTLCIWGVIVCEVTSIKRKQNLMGLEGNFYINNEKLEIILPNIFWTYIILLLYYLPSYIWSLTFV